MSDKAKSAGFASFPQLDQRLKRLDEPRWLATRYLPAEKRRILVALYLLDLDLARASRFAEPMLRLIRLQWWEDALEATGLGTPARGHEVLSALSEALSIVGVPPSVVLPLVSAWQAVAAGEDGASPAETLVNVAAACLNICSSSETERASALVVEGSKRVGSTVAPPISAEVRPLVLHLAAYRRNGTPLGGLSARWRVFMAALTGRIR